MPQAQTGKTRSVPKVVRMNAADSDAVIYRNLGNGRRLPFIWGDTITLASGTTSGVISSGVSFSDHDVSEAIVVVTPLTLSGAVSEYYVKKDTAANVVSLITVASSNIDITYDVMIMLGVGHSFTSADSNQLWK